MPYSIPLCDLHFNMFHDVYNIEMNRPGQNRDYEEEEDPEQDENIDVLN